MRVRTPENSTPLSSVCLATPSSAQKKVEVPPRAPELTIGDGGKADALLFLDDALDLTVFDGSQGRSVDLACRVLLRAPP